MAKKIQVSTVRKEANIEVIEVNASLIAKAVRAGDVAEEAFRLMHEDAPQTEVLDENGEPRCDDGVHPVMETDWDEWRRRGYNGLAVRSMFEKVLPLVLELRDVLLDE